jgi:hypothetical protein
MEYRYFVNEFLTQRDLYRCPKNGRDFLENSNTLAVEYFDPEKNIWTKDQDKIRGVINEMFSGWFDEENDEISEAKALQILARLQKYMNKTNHPFELSPKEVDDFIADYTYADRLFIAFDWNGEHGEKFKDGNLEFRATVTKRFLEINSTNVHLARDLFVEWAACSKEGWGVPRNIVDLGKRFMELGGVTYLFDFLKAMHASFDMIAASTAAIAPTIPKDTITKCLAILREESKKDQSEEHKKLIENGLKLFEKL